MISSNPYAIARSLHGPYPHCTEGDTEAQTTMSKVTLGLHPKHRHTDRKQWPCPCPCTCDLERDWTTHPGSTSPPKLLTSRNTPIPVTTQQSCRSAQPQFLSQGTVKDLPTLTNPARPNLRHPTTEPGNTHVEEPRQGTREGGDLAAVTQHLGFPLVAHVCAPSGLCWRSENQSSSVHRAQPHDSACQPPETSRSRPASTFRLLPLPLSLNPISFP